MLRGRLRCYLVGVACVFILLFLEEVHLGTGYVALMNAYLKETVIPIVPRQDRNASIGVVVVEGDDSRTAEYATARATLRCYCLLHGYPLHEVVISHNATLASLCQHKDVMFRRHCAVAHLMRSWPDTWILFVDADMAVVNPRRLLEEFVPLDDQIHVLFYQRIFNHEVMAGSYTFRNNDFSQSFLQFWADYEYRLPAQPSYHGSDNGALHAVIVEFGLDNVNDEMAACRKHWERSRDYDTLDVFEVCVQLILIMKPPAHIRILEKGQSWARDGWLTNSAWGPSDFIFHGWQKRRRDTLGFAGWHSPLVNEEFSTSSCTSPLNGSLNWRYKDTFIKSDDYIHNLLVSRIQSVHQEFMRIQKMLTSS